MKNWMKYSVAVLTCFMSYSLLAISVEPDTIKIEEVVVSTNRIEIKRDNSPVSVSVITGDDIRNHEQTNVLPVVARITPGVFVSEIGVAGYAMGKGTSGQLSIRGISGTPNARVLTLVDGQPQFMGVFGHPMPNFHMASNIDRVEVIRGPASLLYGSNAMGGVMNFITKKDEKEGIGGSAHLGYGSFNTLRYGVNIKMGDAKWNAGISFNSDMTDGHRDSSDFNMNNINAYVNFKFNDHWKVSGAYTRAAYSFMDPGRENSDALAFFGDIERNLISVSLKNTYENTEGAAYIYGNSGKHHFSDGWASTDRNYGLNLYQSYKIGEKASILGGLDLKQYGGVGSAGMLSDTLLTVTENAAYAIYNQDLNNFTFNLGVRYELHSVSGGEVVPQAGLSYKLTKSSKIKTIVSKGYRNPTIMELYLFYPNSMLLPENLMNYEIAWSQRIGTIANFTFTTFYIEGENLIELQANSEEMPPMVRVNSGNFKNMGVEFESQLMPVKNLNIDFNYSYLSTDQPRLNAPKNQLYLGTAYAYKDFIFVLSLKSVLGLYTNVYSVTPSDYVEDYVLLDAKIRYKFNKNIGLYISAKNLLNQQYQTVYGYTMPGANFSGGLNVKL